MSDDANISIESLIADAVLMEMELESARKAANEITDTRKALAESIREEEQKTADAVYALQRQIEEEKRALIARTQAIRDARIEMADAEYDAKAEARKKQMALESLQRQIDQMHRAELAQTEWATLEKRWDLLTMGAPWREWAKDHQLNGARKMTYEGRMILGDTMGLGKTLTSLIAIDMVEAATKDASPDNPIEFGSMK